MSTYSQKYKQKRHLNSQNGADLPFDSWVKWFADSLHSRRCASYDVEALSLTMPKLPPGTNRLFVPDPEHVKEVQQLTETAAINYTGEPDRSGDPTQPE